MNQKGATALARTEALGRCLSGIAGALKKLSPDIVLILGDRSETLTMAFAAIQLKIPVAHIQGGEISGNIDGIQRHAITKLSHIHFTETKDAKKRVVNLGEEKWRVHYVGAPYIDFLKAKLPRGEKLSEWLKETEGLSFAGITEAIISVVCLGNKRDKVIKILTDIENGHPNSGDFGKKGNLGFNSPVRDDNDDESRPTNALD